MVRKKTHWFFTSLMIGAAFFVCAPMLLSALALIVPSQAYAATSATAVNVIDPASGNIVSTGATPPAGLSGSGSLMSCTFEFTSATESDTFLSNTLGTSDLDLTDGTWADALNGSSAPNGTYFANLNSAEASYIASNYNKSIPIVQLEDAGGTQPVNGSSQSSSDCSTIVLMPLSASLWEGVDFCGFQQGDGTAFTVGAGQSCLNSSNISVSQAQGLTLTPVTMSFTLTGTSGGQSNGTLSYYDNGKNNGQVTQETSSIVVSNTPSNSPASTSTGTGSIGTGASPPPNTTSSSSSKTLTCQSSGFNLSWIVCPIINGIASSESELEGVITSLLATQPVNLQSTNPTSLGYITYKVWSNFRIYGNIFLVIALLVIVFGEAIGGGLIADYTAKKMLPRILIAAILINLSIYIVVALEDIVNVIGGGIEELIKVPFQNAGQWKLSLSGWTGNISGGALGAGLIYGIAAGGEGLAFLGLFVVIPALLAALAVLLTIMLREGILIFLVFTSPIAFALYCLPNTEQYFKKWWDLLFKTLLVYPIIAIVFAMANVTAIVVGAILGSTNPIDKLIGIMALVAPLFLIPLAFRLAGGALGSIHGSLTNLRQKTHEAIKGNPNDPLSRRNLTRNRLRDRNLRYRERAVEKGISMQKTPGAGVVRRRLGGALSGITGGANFEIARSRMNKEAMEIQQMQAATGGDNLIRSVFAKQLKYKAKDGNTYTGWFGTGAKLGEDGTVVGKNAPDFSDYEVNRARNFYGRGSSMYQSAYTYEMGKVGDDEEYGEMLYRNTDNLNGWARRLKSDAGKIQLGAGYAQQNIRKEGKHLKLKLAPAGKSGIDATGKRYNGGELYYDLDHAAFSRDMAEHIGNYQWSNMHTSTTAQMRDSYDWAEGVIGAGVGGTDRDGELIKQDTYNDASRTINDLQLSAQSLDARYGGGPSMVGQSGDQQVFVPSAPVEATGGGAAARRIHTGAAGRVDDELNVFVDHVLGPVDARGNRAITPTSRAALEPDIRTRRRGGTNGPTDLGSAPGPRPAPTPPPTMPPRPTPPPPTMPPRPTPPPPTTPPTPPTRPPGSP